ncbi:MAG: nicotinamide riboside transporter PnuC [Gammaproteobacteria bacterium]|nr:nicotinamide riboside transporter PnuC [Gammaproteobacteria bacterium]
MDWQILSQQFAALSLPEVIAVATAVAYLLLAIRQNIWCWLFAGISTAIYVYLFILAKLYMESVLNVFYFGMAIYGWWVWRRGGDQPGQLPVTVWALSVHTAAIAGIVFVSALNGWLLDVYTDAQFPYVDSLTTWGAIWATFLLARKVLENWWYWLVIDAASIAIYWSRDLHLTALLFCIYVLMIPAGLISWHRSFRDQPA